MDGTAVHVEIPLVTLQPLKSWRSWLSLPVYMTSVQQIRYQGTYEMSMDRFPDAIAWQISVLRNRHDTREAVLASTALSGFMYQHKERG